MKKITIYFILFGILQSFSQTKVWNVADRYPDYTPQQGTALLKQIITDAKLYFKRNNGKLRVLFDEKTYVFSHESSPAIAIHNIKKGTLELSGKGTNHTVFQFNQFDQLGLEITKSDNIHINNIHFTRKKLYASQGTVINTDIRSNIIEMKLHKGFYDPIRLTNPKIFPNIANNHVTVLAYTSNANAPRLSHKTDHLKIKKITLKDKDKSIYRIELENTSCCPLRSTLVGEYITIKAKIGVPTIFIKDSDNMQVDNVLITRATGVALKLKGDCDRTVINNVEVGRRTDDQFHGKKAIYSNLAGGVIVENGKIGAKISNCLIYGTADDGITYHAGNTNILPDGGQIYNNTVRDNHGRGIIVSQSKGGILYGNTLERNRGQALLIKTVIKADNALGNVAVKNWDIYNNTFIENYINEVIWLTTESSNNGKHTNIVIRDNHFYKVPKNNYLIRIDQTNSVTLNNNIVHSFSKKNDASRSNGADQFLIKVGQANEISGRNNKILECTDRGIFDIDTNLNVISKWKKECSGKKRNLPGIGKSKELFYKRNNNVSYIGSLSDNAKAYLISVFDIYGFEIKTLSHHSNSEIIELDQLQKGIYCIKVNAIGEEETLIKKIIVN
ncbi:right-handed parallel beta-helix repeat-containing protein [Aquimarina sp. TRL1]|uniref:right-handed parallel beta-helix repeat-containing protein n=1 Tax=Aquimarina sp. (strain TRL1) TaxID=2736252 RepID=UPI00158992C7|nr:right-handed parallel beta-helix repeat-containing protein [Aquimarina sp. TRL1]QKX05418.1 right-handed parallel beta-helix repeat-containing protein [Aquimarina sp. TRL1]